MPVATLHMHGDGTGRRGPKDRDMSKVRGAIEPQWRESDSAFRRGKEGAGGHAYARQAARSIGQPEWPTSGVCVAAVPAGLGDCLLQAACCVPMQALLREMSRQRARGHVAACGLELGEHAAYARTFLGTQACKHLSCSRDIADAAQRDLHLFTYARQRVAPLFPPAASCSPYPHDLLYITNAYVCMLLLLN